MYQENAEKALFRIIDGSPVATFIINKDHEVIYWNTAIAALTGMKKEEVLGTSHHRKAFFNTDQRIMADLIVDGASDKEIEERYEGKSKKSNLIDGAFDAEDYFPVMSGQSGKWLHFTASPIRDDHGDIIGAIETLADVTERKKAEEALQDSEYNYRNLFESALDPIWVNDEEGYIQAANESTARLTGYSVAELRGSNLSLFLADPTLSSLREIHNKLLLGLTLPDSHELKIVRKNGSEAFCKVATNLIVRNSTTRMFQNIARDVTREKRLYENQQYYLKEITRAQEEERKRIARELHDSTAQNLIALMHQVENLLDEKATLPISQAKSLWSFYEHIRDVLQEVRRFSRDLRPSILDDLGLIPAIEWLSGETKSNYGIEAGLQINGNERRLTPEAELLLFRIVQESVNNVIKHAKATKVDIEVIFAEKQITLVVTDNGVGFSPPVHMGGLIHTGKLGIAGIEERIQLLGGTLKISSEPDRGTSILVSAPV
jgi:two-component system, NarL family, sensor histidine kinase DegS